MFCNLFCTFGYKVSFQKLLKSRTFTSSLTHFIHQEDEHKKGDGFTFAGLYVLHTKQIKASQLKDHRPPILPQDILTNPKKLHNFLIKLHSLPARERIFLVPLESQPNDSQTSKQPKEQETSLTIKNTLGNSLQLHPGLKPAKLNEYVSNAKLWDTGKLTTIHELLEGRWEGKNSKDSKGPQYKELSEWDIQLFDAVDLSDVEAIKSAVINGANVNAQKKGYGGSPLHFAASIGKPAVIKTLLEMNANVNLPASNGSNPLHWAAQNGNLEAVKLLLEHGADSNATTNSWLTDSVFGKSSGQTALHWAAEHGHLEVVMCLMEYGGIPIAEDERGKKPEDVAESKEIRKAVLEEQKREYLCLEFLVPSQGFASEYSLLSKIWEKK